MLFLSGHARIPRAPKSPMPFKFRTPHCSTQLSIVLPHAIHVISSLSWAERLAMLHRCWLKLYPGSNVAISFFFFIAKFPRTSQKPPSSKYALTSQATGNRSTYQGRFEAVASSDIANSLEGEMGRGGSSGPATIERGPSSNHLRHFKPDSSLQ